MGIDKFMGGMNYMLEIQHKAEETYEEFIFTTVKPWCEEVTQQKISKEDLKEALLLWQQAKKILKK